MKGVMIMDEISLGDGVMRELIPTRILIERKNTNHTDRNC